MNGTVNPLYGGNNMNGGAVNDLFIQEQQTNKTQQDELYDKKKIIVFVMVHQQLRK